MEEVYLTNPKEFRVDTEEDMAKIDVNACTTGTIAYIIDTGKLFMLNSKKEWKEQ